MSDVIKAQAQKVYEARQDKSAVMLKVSRLKSGTPQWGEAVDELKLKVNAVSLEEGLLCSLVIEEQLGKFSI